MVQKKLNEKYLLKAFNKYCKNCGKFNFPCCNKCADTTVFQWELEKMIKECENKDIKLNLKNQWGRNGKSKDIKIERISQKDRCPFVDKEGCILKAETRPLDCISYPIYPILKYYKGEKKEIVGMFVHRTCPFAKEISNDKGLIVLVKKFWEQRIEEIKKDDLKHWFGNKRNYWIDKNIIKSI